ncbi:MAG TPA: HD domain-containing protein [Patescibacteria group bacterium]|nr:HD domain-containing protein [Patescibacteria group bacterium]
MPKKDIVDLTKEFVKEMLSDDKSGHDWWHSERTLNLARHIAQKEPGANALIVELGALLHDIADWKFHNGDITAGPRAARKWLESQDIDQEITDSVVYIVEHISFRGGTNKHVMQTLEGKIVQDADRLDAMGAIGIARTFTFGGTRQRVMYDPAIEAGQHTSFEEYQKIIDKNTTINHFYEKLLLLKDGMHTKTAKELAGHRHRVMEQFLDEFYKEWHGEL